MKTAFISITSDAYTAWTIETADGSTSLGGKIALLKKWTDLIHTYFCYGEMPQCVADCGYKAVEENKTDRSQMCTSRLTA